ncbi:MAG TPA: polymer-forming cytoskeletal protein, partial [Candidatus Eisenbacteria bacterium]|nr:polymer-forming cytoskeletal protein [Candidatus Eisenbacteria bacterium]
MRKLPVVLLTAALALAGVPALHGRAAAQETMSFRPVPPESAAQIERDAHAAARTATRAAVRRAVRSATGAGDETPPEPALTDSVPVPPTARRYGRTSGDIVRFGSSIDVPDDQIVQGDVLSIGGNVTVEGKVTGTVTVLGADLTLDHDARVDGDVMCFGGTLRQEQGTSVGGQSVTAPRTHGERFFWPFLAMVGTGVEVMVHVIQLLVFLGIAWLVVKLAPGRTQGALDTLRREPGMTFVIGLLMWALIVPSVIALALVAAILCITIIGIPLAAAVAVGYVAFFVVACVWGAVVGYALLGHRLHQQLKGAPATLLAAALWGAIALQGIRVAGDLLHVVPLFGFLGGLMRFLGFVATVVLTTFGAGALLRAEYSRRTVQDWWHRARP